MGFEPLTEQPQLTGLPFTSTKLINKSLPTQTLRVHVHFIQIIEFAEIIIPVPEPQTFVGGFAPGQ